ncbi:Choline dehydrogenase-like protein [Cladobotryum mycophilum]|uniref:Choline dehydrogenase-like protein n=1 Tax=Cladobotryum mycophilum TaxID=491253 RepID=A0ABR0SK47_9HYPO
MLEVPGWETVLGIFNIFRALWMLVLYLVWGIGVFANGVSPRAIFMRTACIDDECKVKLRDENGTDTMDATKPENVPDVEIMMVPSSSFDRIVTGKSIISFLSGLLQPASVGHLELASTNPEDHMQVFYPYFTDPQDLVTCRKAARFSMRLAQEFVQNSDYPYPASVFMAPSINNETLPPDISEASTKTVVPLSDLEKTWDTVTDAEIDEYVLALGISGLHFSCTCRMSLSPKDGVVDEELRVHGFSNLRVADTSAFPKLPSAHTMLPSMMMGARCADFIRSESRGKKRCDEDCYNRITYKRDRL